MSIVRIPLTFLWCRNVAPVHFSSDRIREVSQGCKEHQHTGYDSAICTNRCCGIYSYYHPVVALLMIFDSLFVRFCQCTHQWYNLYHSEPCAAPVMSSLLFILQIISSVYVSVQRSRLMNEFLFRTGPHVNVRQIALQWGRGSTSSFTVASTISSQASRVCQS